MYIMYLFHFLLDLNVLNYFQQLLKIERFYVSQIFKSNF